MKNPFIPITDLGFRYGYGVFETLLVKSGKVLFKDWHRENLSEAATAMGIAVPDLSPLTKNPKEDGIWRWFLTPSGLQTWFESGLASLPASYRLDWSPLRLSSQAWEARYKTLSYLQHYQAWRQRQGDEVVLLNEHGEIASAAMANIFWFKDGVLYTPELNCGCRRGVIRRWVRENFSAKLWEVRATMTDVLEADEIFLTNSRIGIMPVHELAGRHFATWPLTTHLREQLAVNLA